MNSADGTSATMPQFPRPSCLAAALCVAGILFFTAQALTPLNPLYGGLDSDGRYYVAIAEWIRGQGSTLAHIAPWSGRVLTPLIVAFLPGSVFETYPLVSALCALINLLLLYLLLLQLRVSTWFSCLGMALYGLGFWALRAPLYSPYYIDAPTQTLWLLGLSLALSARSFALCPLLLLGGLQKESFVLLAFIAYALRTERCSDSRSNQLWLCLWICCALAGAGVAQLLNPHLNRYAPEAQIRFVVLEQLAVPLVWPRIIGELIAAAGVLLAPLLAFPRQSYALICRHRWVAVSVGIAVLQLCAGVDKGRLLLPVLPALTFLAVSILQENVRFRVSLALLVVQAWIGAYFSVFGDFEWYLERFAQIHAEVIPWLGIFYLVVCLLSATIVCRLELWISRRPVREFAS